MTEPRYRPSIRSDGLYEIFLYPDDPHWEEANKHLQRRAPYPLSNGRAFVGRAEDYWRFGEAIGAVPSPWDAYNPATLEALVDQHSEDYCEDVPFAPFIQAWRNDLQRLRVEDEFAANVITEQKHRIASLEAMVEGVRADLAHMLAWSRQSQAALTSRRVADAMMGMCENMLDDLAAQEKRS